MVVRFWNANMAIGFGIGWKTVSLSARMGCWIGRV
jgi:hypothetical protein